MRKHLKTVIFAVFIVHCARANVKPAPRQSRARAVGVQCISDRCIKKFCKATHDPIVAPTTQRLAKPATPGAARSERSKYRRRSMHSASARRPCRLPQRRLPRTAEASAFSTATIPCALAEGRVRRPNIGRFQQANARCGTSPAFVYGCRENTAPRPSCSAPLR